MHSGPARGVASGLGAALLFGVSTPVAKLLLPSSGPFLLAGLLYLGAGLGLSVVAPLRRGGREASLRAADLPTLAAMVLAGGVAGPLLLLAGLARLPAAEASLLLNLETPFTIALAVAVFGDSLGRREVLGSVAVVLGGAVLAGTPGAGAASLWGSIGVAGAAMAWAVDNNLGQRLSLRDPVSVTRAKSLVAGAVNLGAGLAMGDALPPAPLLVAALATGFLGYGVSIVLHLVALRHVGAARQAAYFATGPFIGAVASVPVLGERLTGRDLAAGALMALGVGLVLRARHAHLHAHEALEHDHAHVHDAHHLHPHDGAAREPHSHPHRHDPMAHDHPHLPDAHHRHRHGPEAPGEKAR